MKKLIAVAAIAASAILPTNADTWADPDTRIEWTYSVNNAENKTITLGGGSASTPAMPTATVLDAANIPWTMDINSDGEPYTVTALAAYAFSDCQKLTGMLTIPDSVKTMGNRAFQKVGISSVASIGGITTIPNYAFNETSSLTNFSADISKVTKIVYGAFQSCRLRHFYVPGTTTVEAERLFRGNSSFKLFFAGPNTTGSKITSANAILSNVTSSKGKVVVPLSSWNGLVVGGTGNEVISYGASTNLNLSVDDAHGVITATPTDEAALVKVLETAPLFKSEFGWNTRVNITNMIEATSGTITAEMLNAVEFNTMLLTFKVNTQAQLDSVLAAVPASTYPLLAIDASDATEELTVPDGREVYVRLMSGEGRQGKYKPKIKGLVIVFR